MFHPIEQEWRGLMLLQTRKTQPLWSHIRFCHSGKGWLEYYALLLMYVDPIIISTFNCTSSPICVQKYQLFNVTSTLLVWGCRWGVTDTDTNRPFLVNGEIMAHIALPMQRFEPTTFRSRVWRPTDWAPSKAWSYIPIPSLGNCTFPLHFVRVAIKKGFFNGSFNFSWNTCIRVINQMTGAEGLVNKVSEFWVLLISMSSTN